MAKSKYGKVMRMPKPWNGYCLEMKLEQTGMLFNDVSKKLAQEIDEKMKDQGIYDWSKLDFVGAHRPNGTIYRHMAKAFGRNYGLDPKSLCWEPEDLVVDANSPSGTMMFEDLRNLGKMETGAVGMDFYFGAGTSRIAAVRQIVRPGNGSAKRFF
jgi:hypothetical protein